MLLLFNKPFGVLSQFSDKEGRTTLSDYISDNNAYPAGRLDKNSEGLLLLTDDGKLQQHISHPKFKLDKHYWVQIEGEINHFCINQLARGILLNDGMTKPARILQINEPKGLWERLPPVRYRKTIPTQWLHITLHEGRNRQIRRMTAAVNHPTLRIIRHQIGPWNVQGLKPGEHVKIDLSTAFKQLTNYRKI